MEIVKAEEEHLEEVTDMYFEEFKEFYSSRHEAMEEVKQKQKDGTLFVGIVDGKVAGCFGYVRSWTHGANYLEGIVVKKEFRGQGLSKPMLEKFIQVSRDEQQNDFVIVVRSLNRKRWKGGVRYKVSINNLARENQDEETKTKSLLNLNVSCTCPYSAFLKSSRASIWQRKIYGDTRTSTDIPGSFLNSVICRHSIVAFNWLHFNYGTASFGIFGPSEYVTTVSQPIIRRILKMHSKKVPKNYLADYKLNEMILNKETPLLTPLIDMVCKGYYGN